MRCGTLVLSCITTDMEEKELLNKVIIFVLFAVAS